MTKSKKAVDYSKDPRVQLVEMVNEQVEYSQIKRFLRKHPKLQPFYNLMIDIRAGPRTEFTETGELQCIETYIKVGMYEYAQHRIENMRKRLEALEKMIYDAKRAEPKRAR